MTFQIIVCGVATSADGAEWGLVVVGLTEGGASGRAIVIADESGRMASGEAARRLSALGGAGKVSVAPVAKDAAERLAGVLALATREGARPPPPWSMTIGDSAGLWMGVLHQAVTAGRLSLARGLGDEIEKALRDYRPGDDSPRAAALLAAVSYLRDIGGLVGTGTPWDGPVRSPSVAGSVLIGQHVPALAVAERLGAKTEGWG